MLRLNRFAEYLGARNPSLLLEMPMSRDNRRIRVPVAKLLNNPGETEDPKFSEGWEGKFWADVIDSARKTDTFLAWASNLSRKGSEGILRVAALGLGKFLLGQKIDQEFRNQAGRHQSAKTIAQSFLSGSAYAGGVRHLYGQILSDVAGRGDDAIQEQGGDDYAMMRAYIAHGLVKRKMGQAEIEKMVNSVINMWWTGQLNPAQPPFSEIYITDMAVGQRRGIRIATPYSPVPIMRQHLRELGARRAAEEGFLSSAGSAEAQRGNELETRFSRNTARMTTIGIESKKTGREGSKTGFATGGFLLNPGLFGNPGMNYFRTHLSTLGQEVVGVGPNRTDIGPDQILGLLAKKLRTPVKLEGDDTAEPLVNDLVWKRFTEKMPTIIDAVQRAVRSSVGQSKCIPVLNPSDKNVEDLYPFLQFVIQVTAQVLVHASGTAQREGRNPMDYINNIPLLVTVAQEFAYQTAAHAEWYKVDCKNVRFNRSFSSGGQDNDSGDFDPDSGRKNHVDAIADQDEMDAWERDVPELNDEDEDAMDRIKLRQAGMHRAFMRAVENAGLKALKKQPELKAEYDGLIEKQKRSASENARPSDEMRPGETARLVEIMKQIEQMGMEALVADRASRILWMDILEAIPSTAKLLQRYASSSDAAEEPEEEDEEKAASAANTRAATAIDAAIAKQPDYSRGFTMEDDEEDDDDGRDDDLGPGGSGAVRPPRRPGPPSAPSRPTGNRGRPSDDRGSRGHKPRPPRNRPGKRRTKSPTQSRTFYAPTARFDGSSTSSPTRRAYAMSYVYDHNMNLPTFAEFLARRERG